MSIDDIYLQSGLFVTLIIALYKLVGAIVLLTFLWLLVLKGYTTKKGQKVVKLIFTFLLLFFVWEFWNRIIPRNIMGIIPDVSRRLVSPDRSKKALLIRRHAFDLNFKVDVNGKELFYSHDYNPDLTFNRNENIDWSKDSSLLVLSIREPDANEPFKWAYDFKEQKQFLDPNVIEALWIERNIKPEEIE